MARDRRSMVIAIKRDDGDGMIMMCGDCSLPYNAGDDDRC